MDALSDVLAVIRSRGGSIDPYRNGVRIHATADAREIIQRFEVLYGRKLVEYEFTGKTCSGMWEQRDCFLYIPHSCVPARAVKGQP